MMKALRDENRAKAMSADRTLSKGPAEEARGRQAADRDDPAISPGGTA
jgi:hypothetical protein